MRPIVEWFRTCKPEPTKKDVVVQMGVHFEEVAEMTEALSEMEELDLDTVRHLVTANEAMSKLAQHFKNNAKDIHLDSMDTDVQEMLLDSMMDQAVTGIGICTFMNQDYIGALLEVNRSNYSKFDETGKPIFLDNGKIGKSANYSKPNLKPFLGCSKMNSQSYVSIENFICPICGKQHAYEAGILLHKQLKETLDPVTIVGYKICKEHQETIDSKEFVFLLESTMPTLDGLTGRTLQVTAEILPNIFEEESAKSVLEHGIALIEPEAFSKFI